LVVKLKSFLFNNKTKMNLFTKCLLSISVLLYISFMKSPYYVQAVFLFLLIFTAFLSSPRCLIFDDFGIKYNLGWKRKWEDVLSYRIEESNIIIECKHKKDKKISNLDKSETQRIMEFINNKKKRGKF